VTTSLPIHVVAFSKRKSTYVRLLEVIRKEFLLLSKRIYTRAGDKGETGLLSGERIGKDDPRVEAYGTVDELNTVLGIAKVYSSKKIAKHIHDIQMMLFSANAELAYNQDLSSNENAAMHNLRRIDAKDVEHLEHIADELSEKLPLLRNFVVPGGTKAASFLHLSRTVCRRAERRIITFSRDNPVNPELIKYINRLSDVLFVFSRYENIEDGEGDEIISRNGIRKMSP
jgi:cob(I)alamin adenosyltransferase